jgi:hypothetical protein
VWRALGAEADYCPGGGGCISAYWITLPSMLVAGVAAWLGIRLLRR